MGAWPRHMGSTIEGCFQGLGGMWGAIGHSCMHVLHGPFMVVSWKLHHPTVHANAHKKARSTNLPVHNLHTEHGGAFRILW